MQTKMTADEFKALAGFILRTKGTKGGHGPVSLAYKDHVVYIVGIYNLKQMDVVYYQMAAPSPIRRGLHVMECRGRKIKYYHHNDALVKHLLSISVLDQMARS